jgi:hypothetical protein
VLIVKDGEDLGEPLTNPRLTTDDVAANHGGAVGMWSKPGTGSTFTLRIPAHNDTRQAVRTNGQSGAVVSRTDAVRDPSAGAEITGSGL